MALKDFLPLVMGCHQNPNRSFHCHNKPFIICARCTGELAGFFAGLVMMVFFRIPAFLALLFLLPLIIDGSLQKLTSYESTNLKRFFTGSLAGVGAIMFIYHSVVFVFDYFQVNALFAGLSILIYSVIAFLLKYTRIIRYKSIRIFLVLLGLMMVIIVGNYVYYLGYHL